jgi:hypothetical protein
MAGTFKKIAIGAGIAATLGAAAGLFVAPDTKDFGRAASGNNTPDAGADAASSVIVARDPRVKPPEGKPWSVPPTPVLEPGFYRPAVIRANFWQHVNGGYTITHVFDEGMCVHVTDGNAGASYVSVEIKRDMHGNPMEGVMRKNDLRPAPNCG